MTLVVDREHLGPSEAAWARSVQAHVTVPLGELRARRLVIVAPHPDDETFGAGGLLRQALVRRMPIEVIAVTNGEGSHPHSPAALSIDLPRARDRERAHALLRLGWNEPQITRLHIPDGRVSEQCDQLEAYLGDTLMPDDLCLAPWRFDGHPDHDACGEAALRASRSVRATMLGYLVWAWHWADPDADDIPWRQCRRLPLTRRDAARKRWATGAYVTQTHALGSEEEDQAVIPPPVLRRFWREYELFVDENGECGAVN